MAPWCGGVESRRSIGGMKKKQLITNVILSAETVSYLDCQLLAIRQTSGAAINRSQLLRGIASALMAARIDFSRCRTERDISGMLGFTLSALGGR